MAEPVLELSGISRRFDSNLTILDRTGLTLQRSELVALVGASGLGKSTLLHIAGLMERPDRDLDQKAGQGIVRIMGEIPIGDAERTLIRRQHIGFVFQFHHLLPEFTALENVALVSRIGGQSPKKAKRWSEALLTRVGLGDRLHHYPATLSGGECQRVAIARALVNLPAVLLLDEPTGNLDAHTAANVFRLIRTLVGHDGPGCLYATHNQSQAEAADRRLTIHEGKVVPGS